MSWTLILPTLFVLAPTWQGKQVPRESVLLLSDGTRIAGKVVRTTGGYRVQVGPHSRRFAAADVQRWIPRSELLKKLDDLAAMPGGSGSFQTAQRAIWAFGNGLADRAWPLYGRLLAAGARPAAAGRLEQVAARWLIDHGRRRSSPVDLARRLLLAVNGRDKSAAARARRAATRRALVVLLDAERRRASQDEDRAATTKKGARSVANLCRKYAAGAVSSTRRSIARRALLAFDDKGKSFVWRQTMVWPRGPNRSAVVAEIRDAGQAGDAALYLTRWLGRGSSTMKVRSAEALGEIGSKKALPALHAMRRAIRKKVRRRAVGAGATRANVAFLDIQSYIRDVDVEVAQAAAIADPVIGQIRSGVVLDATVGGITWDRYIILLDHAVKKAIDEIEKAQD